MPAPAAPTTPRPPSETAAPRLFPLAEIPEANPEPTLEELAAARRVMAAVHARASGDNEYGMDDDWPEFVAKMRMLTPQSYGKRIESYLIRRHGWSSVSSSDDRGDARTVDAETAAADPDAGEYIEIKASMMLRTGGKVNVVQIRPWQDITGYRIFVIDADDRLHRFDLTADQMKAEVEAVGSLAHGTKAVGAANPHAEYAVRFRWSPVNETCVRWRERYEVDATLPERSSAPEA